MSDGNNDDDRILRFIGKFEGFQDEMIRRAERIENKLDEVVPQCAARGVTIENACSDITQLKEDVGKKADKDGAHGTTKKEKIGIWGAYILQIVLEVVRYVRTGIMT